jgi:cytochrome c-type biogenesis protein
VEELFSKLSHAVEGAPGVALGASFIWGVLSVVLSPCHLSSIPLVIGFISGQGGRMTTRRAFALSSLFSIGILVTIGAIGAITAVAGRMMGDIGTYGNYFVAVIFLLVGLHLLGVIPAPWGGPGKIGMKRKGALAAFVLGLLFGIALGPCTFAYMAPMLAVTFRLASSEPAYGILLLLAYGVGHCSVIVLAGTSTELLQRYLDWTADSRGAAIVRGICGILVIAGGLYLIYITGG